MDFINPQYLRRFKQTFLLQLFNVTANNLPGRAFRYPDLIYNLKVINVLGVSATLVKVLSSALCKLRSPDCQK